MANNTGPWIQAAANTASGAMAIGMQRLGAGYDRKQQLETQARMMDLQMRGEKEMMDYQNMKQMEMWNATGYKAQLQQMKDAGLSPGLIYGKGGGGGQTVGGSIPSVTGGHAQYQDTAGMGMKFGVQTAMELALLNAQKENIEADTRNKTADAEGKGLENAFTAWMQGTTTEGEQATNIDQSVRGQKDVSEVNKNRADTTFKMDENERQKLMNSKVMEEIGAKISLMHKQGLSQDEIYKNLSKEGKLLDAEIEWNKLDISGNPGKFITNIIKMLFKPR